MNKKYKYDVSFISINYNSSELTAKLVTSIVTYTKLVSYEIIIVDNNSKIEDISSIQKFLLTIPNHNIRYIQNNLNSGFASGNMLGYSYCTGKYVFFINNDARLLNNCAFIMKTFLEKNRDVGLATSKVLDENNNFHSSYKQFPSVFKQLFGNAVARFFSEAKFPSNRVVLREPSAVEVVSGSCMFFDVEVFEFIGGFDKNFFLYCEEEDICKRVWNSGKKVYFIPESEVYHEGGGSSEKNFEMLREYYISYNILINKHFNLWERFFLKFALLLKQFRRVFSKKYGLQVFLFILMDSSPKKSLKHQSKTREDMIHPIEYCF